MAQKNRVIIIGAAGRDFHNFNLVYRNNPAVEVVAFTATQIPNIEGRIYPPLLSGENYPNGIPILPENDLEQIIRDQDIHQAVFAYSDVSHETVMHLASRVNAAGADFVLLGNDKTQLKAHKPVISVCAVRTGCGKSQTSRKIASLLRDRDKLAAVIRHPMPYGDLARQRVQRFANHADLVTHDCTIEEIEEYEQYVERGLTIFAGVDYGAILAEAEKDGDLVLWDGGNNDTPFIRPDLHIVVVDPLRAGHELLFHPGETNLCMADVVVINKVDRAAPEDLEIVLKNIEAVNPAARIIQADSEVMLENPEQIQGRRVLVIEDGPTLTHGGMAYGAGTVAAQRFGAGAVIDPAPYAVGSIAEAYKKFPHMGAILPALGYYPEQLSELEETIRRADCDAVIVGTPVDLRRYVKIDQPALRVTYELAERAGELTLSELVDEFVLKHLS